jgi:hypothetical protein
MYEHSNVYLAKNERRNEVAAPNRQRLHSLYNITILRMIFHGCPEHFTDSTPGLQGRGYATATLRSRKEVSRMVVMTPQASEHPAYSCVPLQPPLPYTSSPTRLVYQNVYYYQHSWAQSG